MELMVVLLVGLACLLLGAALQSGLSESSKGQHLKNGRRRPIYIMQGQGRAAVTIYADMLYHIDVHNGRTFENVGISIPLDKNGQPDTEGGYLILHQQDGKIAYLGQQHIVCIIEAEAVAESAK